jgi:hypothetical protein
MRVNHILLICILIPVAGLLHPTLVLPCSPSAIHYQPTVLLVSGTSDICLSWERRREVKCLDSKPQDWLRRVRKEMKTYSKQFTSTDTKDKER